MTRLLVFGGTGLLGSHICQEALGKSWDVVATHHSTTPDGQHRVDWRRCDITDPDNVRALVETVRPDVAVNAAYVQSGAKVAETCAEGAENIALASDASSVRLIHISTDLVFDGTLGRPYREVDQISPISDYGRAKARGESLVRSAHPDALVIRTSLIYGDPSAPQETLVRRAAEGQDIAFFTDEWRSPVEVERLAAAICTLATSDHSGILHIAGEERLNRLEFARLLATQLGLDPTGLVGRTRDPTLGPRPEDVSLDCSVSSALGLAIPGPSSLLAQS